MGYREDWEWATAAAIAAVTSPARTESVMNATRSAPLTLTGTTGRSGLSGDSVARRTASSQRASSLAARVR